MAFSLPANTNSTEEVAKGVTYTSMRVMTVGTKTSSKVLLQDLQTVQEVWSVPSTKVLSLNGRFGQFSSVCWFFGKQIYEKLNKTVPIGLVSDNWGGTPVESWSTAASQSITNHKSKWRNVWIRDVCWSEHLWYWGQNTS